MKPAAVLLFLVTACALLTVPRKWALAPLLVGCCYMTLGQGVEIGPFSFPMYRMLLAVGVVRVIVRGERLVGGFNRIDYLMVVWSVWVLFASLFHAYEAGSGPIYASGVIFNLALIYFLVRIWTRDIDEIVDLIKIIAILLAPVAFEMAMEKFVGRNAFAVFGGVSDYVLVREGKLRAQGPFRSPILGGVVGATCIPLFVGIWGRHRFYSAIGVLSGICMTLASASSGPMISAVSGVFAIVMWRFRRFTGVARAMFIAIYIVLDIIRTRPTYYLMGEIDLVGGSTGWFRARLIESAFEHFSEWWLFGTDYTRNWMATGVSFSPNHTDITNYYIGFAVVGGLAAMLLIIAMFFVAFRWVGDVCRSVSKTDLASAFGIWCLGAGLFAHAVTGITVSYFDQSMVFIWANVAMISSLYSGELARRRTIVVHAQAMPMMSEAVGVSETVTGERLLVGTEAGSVVGR